MTAPGRGCALITGARGQVGLELQATCPAEWELVARDIEALDVTDGAAVHAAVREARPTVVIHAAAFTAVEGAETAPAQAEAVNVGGTTHVAEAARAVGARLVYISTDFVFDGTSGHPYPPDATPNPLGVYGRTKLAGERVALRVMGGRAAVVRTAWVYSRHGQNFVLTMLRLMRERPEVGVVCDQVGTPTWARSLAGALWTVACRPDLEGVFHWTDAGVASWYDFAVAIQEEALAVGLLRAAVPVRPLRSEDYPSPARRPAYSVLEKALSWTALGLTPPHWRVNLRCMLEQLPRS